MGVDLRATHINKRLVLALLADPTRGAIQREKYSKTKAQLELIAENLRQGIGGYPNAEAAAKDLAARADLADLADLAYLAARADLADLAARADLADLAEILLEVLAASAPSTSLAASSPLVNA